MENFSRKFLDESIEVIRKLDDDSLRYFFPRLMELMLRTPAPVFDFRLAELKDRLPSWQSAEPHRQGIAIAGGQR